MNTQSTIAVIYGAQAGSGGLGMQAATALTALAEGEVIVHAFGPGHVRNWALPGTEPSVVWNESPQFLPPWTLRYSWWRWYQGHYQFESDRRLGHWARRQIERLLPKRCYVFTQVGLEVLRWAGATASKPYWTTQTGT